MLYQHHSRQTIVENILEQALWKPYLTKHNVAAKHVKWNTRRLCDETSLILNATGIRLKEYSTS